ncbi:MAG: AmmeMemoRadiSam system radical SAM enzyme [Ignavibacteria bacterium]|nr:AmmeMemoRadiSam system radical SAM enzyme [Ignavibacteria bacterium]
MHDEIHHTIYWHALDDGRVQCDLCPRLCKLREGQHGPCFVRMNEGNSIVLTTYGRSSGFCVDPIEKKPLNHFLPGTPVLSFGTAGCNLSCRFCQNWDISHSRENDRLTESASPEAIALAARRMECASVAFTYNEPVIFMEYAVDVALACHASGIRTVAVTAGAINPKPRAEFFRHIDAANVDLKAFSEGFYRSVCGAQLGAVKDTLRYLKHETSVWFEITTLLIPGMNDSEQEIEDMTQWIASALGPDVPLHFTAFHPDGHMRDIARTPAAVLRRARDTALRNGLRYVYTGNIRDLDGATTRCHACGTTLIVRDGYDITSYAITAQGACRKCAMPVAGVFASAPGTWGSRRQTVRIAGEER